MNIIPTSLYDVPAVETWLEQQSRRGKHLRSFYGEPWACFDRGAPQAYRYRMEPCRKKEGIPSNERKELYAAEGWEYVCSTFWEEFHVWCTARPDARELHTDPVVEGCGYEWLEKRLRRRHGINLVFIAVLAAAVAGMLIRHPISLDRLIWDDSLAVRCCLETFLLLWGGSCAVSDARAIRRLLPALRSGIPMEHRAPVRGCRRALTWTYFMAFVLLNTALMVPLLSNDNGNSYTGPLAEYPGPLPCVTMAQLGEPALGEGYGYRQRSSWLTSAAWEMREGRPTRGSQVINGQTWYSYTYPAETEVVQLRLVFLAQPLAREYARAQQNAEPLPGTPFDSAWYGAGEGRQFLLVQRGPWVLKCSASVPEDLRDHLEEYEAVLDRLT